MINLEAYKKQQERIKKQSEENGRIARLAKEEFKNVTIGTVEDKFGMFVLGFLAGYKSKEKGK